MVEAIPRWYSPWGHLAGTAGVGVITVAVAISQVENLRFVELLTLGAVFFLANLFEWWVHKHVMHRRRAVVSVLYDRHTPEHHRIFVYENMAVRAARELRLVLIPAAGVLGIVLLTAPAAFLAGILLGENVGWLVLSGVALYVVGYELTHLCYHLPEGSFVYRWPLTRFLREHHARHHQPELMQRFNFNVTVPLGDLLFGTMAPRGPGGERHGREPLDCGPQSKTERGH